MGTTIQALMTGQTKEELEKKGAGWKTKGMRFLGLAMMLMLAGRYFYTQKQKAEAEAIDAEPDL